MLVPESYTQTEKCFVTKSNENFGSIIMSVGVGYYNSDALAFLFNKYAVNGCNYDFSIGFRHHFSHNFAYRVVLENSNYAINKGVETPTGAGLFHSTTNLLELTARGEYTIKFGSQYQSFKRNSIYSFVGGGVLVGDVVSEHENSSVYPDFRAGILLVGLGYSYNINSNIYIGTELTTHYALINKIGANPLIAKQGDTTCNDAVSCFTLMLGVRIF